MVTDTAGGRSPWVRWLGRLSLTAWRDSSRDRIVIDAVLLLVLCAAVVSHRGWAWLAVLVVLVRLVGEVVADQQRRPACGRAETRIDSPGQAIRAAEEMLNAVAVGQRARCDAQSARLWLTLAVYPLAALLYAASPRGNDRGMTWVYAQASQMDDAAAWQQTAMEIAAVDLRMYGWINGIAEMDARQRASIAMAMREAVAARLESASPR